MAYYDLLLYFLNICALFYTIGVRAEFSDTITILSNIENLLRKSQQVSTFFSSSYIYAVERSWLIDLKCYIQKTTRKFTDDITCNLFPRPLTMSHEGNNDFIEENLWKLLVKTFGVDADHDLSRIHVKDYSQVHYANDYIMTKADVIRRNSDINEVGVNPPLWMFPKEERLGYVMTQLRHYYEVPSSRQSRLWYEPDSFTSWLVQDLNKTICNVREALNIESILNGVQGTDYVEIAKKSFPNTQDNQHKLSRQRIQSHNHNHNKNSQDASYTVSEFSDDSECSPIFGLLVLEVESSNGEWPSGRYAHLIPKNSFELSFGKIESQPDDEDDVSRKNTSEIIEKWLTEVIHKIEVDLKEEMLTIYDLAKGRGEQKCEKLENRETYMHELEEGLKTLQEQTSVLKNRLRELRGYKEDIK